MANIAVFSWCPGLLKLNAIPEDNLQGFSWHSEPVYCLLYLSVHVYSVTYLLGVPIGRQLRHAVVLLPTFFKVSVLNLQ